MKSNDILRTTLASLVKKYLAGEVSRKELRDFVDRYEMNMNDVMVVLNPYRD